MRAFGLFVVLGFAAHAGIVTETVTYEAGGTALEGYLARPAEAAAQRPAVIVIHEWYGVTEHPRNSARRLAELGYVAFAADMYGKGRVTSDHGEAAAWSSELKENPALARERFAAALAVLEAHEGAGPVAAIGYCFGGTMALDMARLGLPLRGVVSFHGGLESAIPKPERNIEARILVLHGADDPLVPEEEVAAFREEMLALGAEWTLIAYAGAVHSFTNPDADSEAARYHAEADAQSWQDLLKFLDEIFP